MSSYLNPPVPNSPRHAEPTLPSLLLRLDVLKPGDVIITRSSGLLGTALAAASHVVGTKDFFSHAAIVLNKHHRFEADDAGLVITPFFVSFATPGGLTLQDVSHYAAIRVLRHPALAEIQGNKETQIAKQLQDLTKEYHAKEYPKLDELKRAAAKSPLAQKFAGLGLQAIDMAYIWFRGDEQPEVPGPFCSMLVAVLLQRLLGSLGLRAGLFTDGRPPNTVSPNALASESSLVEVPEATPVKVPPFTNKPNFVTSSNQIMHSSYREGMTIVEAEALSRQDEALLVQGCAGVAKMVKSAASICEETRKTTQYLESLRNSAFARLEAPYSVKPRKKAK